LSREEGDNPPLSWGPNACICGVETARLITGLDLDFGIPLLIPTVRGGVELNDPLKGDAPMDGANAEMFPGIGERC